MLRIALALVLFAVLAPPAVAQTPACSKETATALVQPTDPNTNGRVVDAVYCGAFLGPGSEAMVVVIASQGGCVIVGGWQVFSLVAGAWTPSTDGLHEEGGQAVRIDGTAVIEERRVHRRTDWGACLAGGGEQARTWIWDGAAGLTAGAWQQTSPARPKGEVLNLDRGSVDFRVAGAPIRCFMISGIVWEDDAIGQQVSCAYRRTPRSTVNLFGFGGLHECNRRSSCRFDDTGDVPLSVLRTGQYAIIGRYRCSAADAGRGVRCVATRNGKGFLLNATGVHRVK